VDITRGEQVEAELDALIRRRHDQRVQSEGERAREALWQESVRCYHERKVWVAADGFAYAQPEVRTTREAEGAA
jgi:hypothetical protein